MAGLRYKHTGTKGRSRDRFNHRQVRSGCFRRCAPATYQQSRVPAEIRRRENSRRLRLSACLLPPRPLQTSEAGAGVTRTAHTWGSAPRTTLELRREELCPASCRRPWPSCRAALHGASPPIGRAVPSLSAPNDRLAVPIGPAGMVSRRPDLKNRSQFPAYRAPIWSAPTSRFLSYRLWSQAGARRRHFLIASRHRGFGEHRDRASMAACQPALVICIAAEVGPD